MSAGNEGRKIDESRPRSRLGNGLGLNFCIKARVAELPPEFDGALVVANGSQDTVNGRITFTAQIYGKKGHA